MYSRTPDLTYPRQLRMGVHGHEVRVCEFVSCGDELLLVSAGESRKLVFSLGLSYFPILYH